MFTIEFNGKTSCGSNTSNANCRYKSLTSFCDINNITVHSHHSEADNLIDSQPKFWTQRTVTTPLEIASHRDSVGAPSYHYFVGFVRLKLDFIKFN